MMQSVRELEENLGAYVEQLEQVRQLCEAEPNNAEYGDMVRELEEVIELTQDLLKSAKQTEPVSSDDPLEELDRPDDEQALDSEELPGRIPVGTKVQAVWSEDGEWYDATIEAITPVGYFVSYDEWGNKEEVDLANVRAFTEKEAEDTRLALKRKIAKAAVDQVMPRDLPSKLKINPEDSEDLKVAKRKKIHAFKSKQRLEQIELTQNKRQNAWQQFQGSKGKSKKVGFFTGRKKESIFKSPDDPKGKVGVTGSGKGITEFHKREKHLHMRIGGEDGEDWQ